MTSPSLTYTFTNNTTADASQVMQNFNDLLNGITDGTKDLSVYGLTAAGTATLNGSVTLGSASDDVLTIAASLASTIPIKTTNTYNIGSATLGLAGIYFGTGDTDTARIVAASTFAASRTYTLPDAGGAANFVLSEGTATINGIKTFAGQVIAKGTATDDDASVGYIGEHISALGSAVTMTSATFFDITSIPLTAGDWEVTGWCVYSREGATFTGSLVDVELGISNASGTSGGRLAVGDTHIYELTSSTTFTNHNLAIGPIRVLCDGVNLKVGGQLEAAGLTLYLKGYAGAFSAGAPTVSGTLKARRVR